MLAVNVGSKRLYAGKPARTKSYTLTYRCDIDMQTRILVDRPRLPSEKQARKGRVFTFQPDPNFQCCTKKQCSKHFLSAKCPTLEKARSPMLDHFMSREAMRAKLRANWTTYLSLPDGSRCCKSMMLKIYNCSPSMLYGDKRPDRDQGDSNRGRSSLSSDIASFLKLMKSTADCMPDEGWYQLNMPMRCMVWSEYNEEAKAFGLLRKCTNKGYFYKVWDDNFPELRLRKHCKFAKCNFCVNWRKISEEPSRKAEAAER